MRKIKLLIVLLFYPLFSYSQEKSIDSTAVYILDHMSEVIGQLSACSFHLYTSSDQENIYPFIASSKEFTEYEVIMQGANKMMVLAKGYPGNRGFYYNGTSFTRYSFDENNYTTIGAPDNTLSMIDSINHSFGVEFPAADFFYPSFTDDLIDDFDEIHFLGKKTIRGKEAFQIAAIKEGLNVQIWISNDALILPLKLLIINTADETPIQYEATFSDWQINTLYPEKIFDFTPPPGARIVAILPKPL
ncbi:DUF2092 domain-containing protein [Echinicola marina]|uniref:DUF2092 domain-containing protein n=1 Tax=Echinicola marina TaxID=2859768 RepID=UPI001CF63C86|nr:DUF2092 domain-containing protein [Echinicola marina]UCS92371.1 DUF2092 domain-containing protein [Echinicola marina]